MLALLAAAAVAAASQPVQVLNADGAPVSLILIPSGGATPAQAMAPMPNHYTVPERCRNLPYQVVDEGGRPVAVKLGDLPRPGGLQLLVDRRIDGCRVITVKQGRVQRDEPDPPPERYRVMPLDGRSNRR
jgi:hypothetical protein